MCPFIFGRGCTKERNDYLRRSLCDYKLQTSQILETEEIIAASASEERFLELRMFLLLYKIQMLLHLGIPRTAGLPWTTWHTGSKGRKGQPATVTFFAFKSWVSMGNAE